MNIQLLIGEQADEKTMATSFICYRNAKTIDIKPNYGKTESEAFTGSAYKGQSFVPTYGATADLAFEMTCQTVKNLLPAFGYTVAAGTETITGWTITDLGKANASGKVEKYYTIIEQNLEDQEERILTGAQFNTVDVAIEQGAYCTMTISALGYNYIYQDSITHTTYTELADVDNKLTSVVSNLEMGTDDVSTETQSVTISINNNLEQKYGLGSRNATRITRNGFVEASAAITLNSYMKQKFKEGIEALQDETTIGLLARSCESYASGKPCLGIMVHKMNVTDVSMTDKNAGGGLTENLDISYDITAGTPITFCFGTVD